MTWFLSLSSLYIKLNFWFGIIVSKSLITHTLGSLTHKTEEKDLKELWSILCLDEVNKYYLIAPLNYDWEKEKVFQYKKLKNTSAILAGILILNIMVELKASWKIV